MSLTPLWTQPRDWRCHEHDVIQQAALDAAYDRRTCPVVIDEETGTRCGLPLYLARGEDPQQG